MRRASGGLAFAVMLWLACGAVMAGHAATDAPQPKIYIDAQEGFATALTAAMLKKKVPAIVVGDKSTADYILQSAAVDSKDETTAGKLTRCIFVNCIGMNGFSEVSVKLVRVRDSAIVWAYQVRKANSGPMGIQSMSEAIAKHLKNDYLDKLRT